MSDSQSEFGRGKAKPVRGGELLVSDVIRYMSNLAKIHDSARVGNAALSRGLHDLARALRPYKDRPASELAEVIRINEAAKHSAPAAVKRRAMPENLPDFKTIGLDEVERILEDESLPKRVLAELGFQRFGISRSMLEHSNKKEARHSIASAVENRRILEAISRQARKGGMARSA